ncbi:NAD(+)--rifampin ADP-ribosyltransferase, partial [Bacillus altitudinis]|uniref:NAD(+)--rifampin ADP-ribosyltransferase n=1 Tax=Bacillus altitudinis TaxID=293387 RepID=UPI00164380E3
MNIKCLVVWGRWFVCVLKKSSGLVLDGGWFFHGRKGELKIGEVVEGLDLWNYEDKEWKEMYFSGRLKGGKWGGELGGCDWKERIYVVEG